MKGDIAFAGFVLTAAEWQELDREARSQLIAVATRRADPWLAAPVDGRLAEGSGPLETEELLELEPDLEPGEHVEPGQHLELGQHLESGEHGGHLEPPGGYIDLFDSFE